jgi:hypothetical protein
MFESLLQEIEFFEAAGQLAKIGLILKPKQHNQVNLVQNPDTHFIIGILTQKDGVRINL